MTGQQLAAQLAAVNNEIASLVQRCTAEQWQRTDTAEGWTVAAVAHHVAEIQQAFVGMVEQLAAGKTFTPGSSMERVHRANAQHAKDFAAVDQQEVLALLQASQAAMTPQLAALTVADLSRDAGVFGDNALTVAQVIEQIVIAHCQEHLGSMQDALAG